MSYLIKRCAQGAFLLVGVSMLSFLFLELAPGDFFEEMRLNPQISPETVANLRRHYGLDQPLPVRYWRWLQSVGRGEFGYSFAYGTPVAPLLRVRMRNTLLLTGSATVIAWIIAIPLGVFSASRKGGWFDRSCEFATSTLLATPDLLLALGALLLAVRSGWFHAGGMMSASAENSSTWTQWKDVASHLALPAAVPVLGGLPVLLRHIRATMLDVLDTPFVRAASVNGISPSRALFRHAFPAALNPLISLFGLSLASLLSASLLVEVVMSWPGLGPLLLEAILARDVYVVIGAVVLSTVFLVGGTLFADLLLFAADPRIRAEGLA